MKNRRKGAIWASLIAWMILAAPALSTGADVRIVDRYEWDHYDACVLYQWGGPETQWGYTEICVGKYDSDGDGVFEQNFASVQRICDWRFDCFEHNYTARVDLEQDEQSFDYLLGRVELHKDLPGCRIDLKWESQVPIAQWTPKSPSE